MDKPLTAVWVRVKHTDYYKCTRCSYLVPASEVDEHKVCPDCGSAMKRAG